MTLRPWNEAEAARLRAYHTKESRPMATTAASPLTVEERRHQVGVLVAAGRTEREIAERLGVSRTTVWTDKQVLKAAAER